jgi:glycosyltransferase involved in cell wall biosynthesis
MATSEISAYIPCFNNATTLAAAIASLHNQSFPPAEVVVIDDGSSDESVAVAVQCGARVVRQGANLGRGAARERAMREVRHELVVCLDATNALPSDFVERAVAWFERAPVAAVYGRLTQAENGDPVLRWRGRHLFLQDQPGQVRHRAPLSTYGALVRRSAVLAVGNFDAQLRHSEDHDLGERLIAAGWDVISDPHLTIVSLVHNTLFQVLERYWRWYVGKHESLSVQGYLKQINYSLKVMVRRDLVAGDYACIPISLLCPHFQFWYTLWRRIKGQAQTQ